MTDWNGSNVIAWDYLTVVCNHQLMNLVIITDEPLTFAVRYFVAELWAIIEFVFIKKKYTYKTIKIKGIKYHIHPMAFKDGYGFFKQLNN